MRIISVVVALLICIHINALSQTIQFEDNKWQAIVAKAKKQKKVISLNICSSWSKQCSTMAGVFQNDTAANYYNQSFINVNIDIDTKEGKAIAKLYPAAVYPMQSFIHPATGAVFYSEYGETDAAGYIKRGTLALEEYQADLPYNKLIAKFEKGTKDKAFIQDLLAYGHKLNKNPDNILNEYVQLYFKNNPSESDIDQLHQYITTIDNLGTIYIYNLALATKDEQFTEEVHNWIADLFTNTYIKAVEHKNEKIIEKIKMMAQKINHSQIESIYYYYLQQYYKALFDDIKYQDAIKNEMDYYANKSIAVFKQEDSIAYIDIDKEYRSQLKVYGIAEDKMSSYIQQNTAGNPQAASSVSYMAADQINNMIELILADKTKFSVLLPHLSTWGDKMIELMQGYDSYLAYLSINYARVLIHNGKEQQAKSLLVNALKSANDNNALYNKIKDLYDTIH